MIVYDDQFNLNEWFIIVNLLLVVILISVTRKIFTKLEGLAFYIFGVTYGMFYDHTVSIKPWDLYDVNDRSAYEFFDFLSYVMYGGYSYFFIYLYERLKIRGLWNLTYVIIWSCISFFVEWIGVKIGLFHFEKGYNSFWSFPIYITAQSMLIIFYQIIKKKSLNTNFSKT